MIGTSGEKLSARELGQAAMATVSELSGHQPESLSGLEWDGDSWCVRVDVVEMARIPRTADVLATYEVRLDDYGTLRGYRRVMRFTRGGPLDDD